MRDPYPVHGKRRHWRAPWRVVCRCGMDAWPCIVERMLSAARDDDVQVADKLYEQGMRSAREWRDMERRRWSGGAR